MNWTTIIGSLAAICSMVNFNPQAWRIVRMKDTQVILPVTYSFTTTGFAR